MSPMRHRLPPTLPVSVIVPCFQAPEALERTLAGLEGQVYVSVSPSGSVAVKGAPMSLSAPVFSLTVTAAGRPESKTGASLSAVPVLPAPGSDQSPGISPLSARTRAWYCVADSSSATVARVSAPLCSWSLHGQSVPARYCTW